MRDITEGKCRHCLFGSFSIKFLFAKEYSKLNGNPSINFTGWNAWNCTTLQLKVNKKIVLSWWSSGRVQGQLFKGHRFNSSSYIHEHLLETLSHNNPSLPLHLHQLAKKIKDEIRLLFCLLVILWFKLWKVLYQPLSGSIFRKSPYADSDTKAWRKTVHLTCWSGPLKARNRLAGPWCTRPRCPGGDPSWTERRTCCSAACWCNICSRNSLCWLISDFQPWVLIRLSSPLTNHM